MYTIQRIILNYHILISCSNFCAIIVIIVLLVLLLSLLQVSRSCFLIFLILFHTNIYDCLICRYSIITTTFQFHLLLFSWSISLFPPSLPNPLPPSFDLHSKHALLLCVCQFASFKNQYESDFTSLKGAIVSANEGTYVRTVLTLSCCYSWRTYYHYY